MTPQPELGTNRGATKAATADARSIVKGWIKEIRASGEVEVDKYSGKRREPRLYPWAESLELRVDGRLIVARGENLSSGGVGLVCKQNLTRGAVVEMRCVGEDAWVRIRVMHCTQSVGTYKIGALFVNA